MTDLHDVSVVSVCLPQDTVEFRLRQRMLRVRTPDNAARTLYVDEAKTVYQLMDDVCHRMRITNNHSFSLARDTEMLEGTEGTLNMRANNAKQMMIIRKNVRTEETGNCSIELQG